MGQTESKSVFSTLLTQDHVERALLHHGREHNAVPMALATVALLNGSPAQLQAVCEHEKARVEPWTLSPARITSLEERQLHLGDARFQRSYMDYFSMQHGQVRGNSYALVLTQLFSGEDKMLIYGLFGGFGAPLVSLGDAVELQSPLLVVQSLVLASVDWGESIQAVLCHPSLSEPPEAPLTPEAILARIAYDGRFSGLMKKGPGFKHSAAVLANSAARAAIIDYVQQLDVTDIPLVLVQLASLSATLLGAAHKRSKPAFDYSLGFAPALVQSLRVLAGNTDDPAQQVILVRGVWLLIVLAYVTQLRPVLDRKLIYETALSPGEEDWPAVLAEFRGQQKSLQKKYLDSRFLRVIRSLQELALAYGDDDGLYLRSAWKLRREWQAWTGLGKAKEETLNIRL